jgi:hypothetical protein
MLAPRRPRTPSSVQEARERVHALVSDLPRVGNDPRTPARERKRILRLLIEDVTLIRDREIHLHIRWKGGATTSLQHPLPRSAPDLRRTSAAVVELVRVLATEQTDHQIAETLNRRWLRTGTGQRFTRLGVRRIRRAYGIRSLAQHKRQAGWHTTAEISAAPSASTTRVRFSLNHSPECFPKPIAESDCATGVVTPSLHRTCAKRCSMKPDPFATASVGR